MLLSMSTQIHPMCKVQGGSGVTETHLQIKVPDLDVSCKNPILYLEFKDTKQISLEPFAGSILQ